MSGAQDDNSRKYAKVKTPSRELAEQVVHSIDEEGILLEEQALAVLHHRGGQEELEIGLEYVDGKDPLERITGARILAELGNDPDRFREEAVLVLIKLLKDRDERVIDHAAVSLAARQDARAVPHLAALDEHHDPSIRHAVVMGLSGQDDPKAIGSLIKLAKDEDRDVRNWAIFSLGSKTTADTRRIRQVLCDAMTDEDDEIMGEAMVGLAARGDTRVVHALLKWWKKEPPFGLTLEAAALIAAPELVPPLEKLAQEMTAARPGKYDPAWRTDLEYALGRCRGEVTEG